MSCGNSCNKKVTECHKTEVNECHGNTNSSCGANANNSAFVIIIVLYILLAIIVGSYIL